MRNKKAPKLLHFRAITLKKWSRFSDLNRRPHPYHGCALPAELNRRWWWNMDLNHGRLPSTDLQSVAIDHSAIPPYCLCYVFCCQSYLVLTGAGKGIRTYYKSAALPTELHRLQQFRNFTGLYSFCQAGVIVFCKCSLAFLNSSGISEMVKHFTDFSLPASHAFV